MRFPRRWWWAEKRRRLLGRWRKLLSRWPLVWRKRADTRRVADLSRLRRDHRIELEKSTECAAEIVARARCFRWDEAPHGQYRLTLTLDPHVMLMGGGHDQHGLDMLADLFGREVAREIRTSKFVEEAQERRRDAPALP